MAQHSGFFNALQTGGVYDRQYNADDYSENLAIVISDGVLRSSADDLKPTANGMAVNIGIGRAWIRGKWYKNDTEYSFVVPTASPAYARKDRIFLRLDNTIGTRDISLYYAEGTAASSPVAPEPQDTDTVKDLVICEIDVPVSATSVTLTDKRGDADLCGWVYSVIGDGSFFKSLDGEFNQFMSDKRDTLASVTLFKQYAWSTTTAAGQSVVIFDIPQYDPTGVDIIEVYLNGIMQTLGTEYTLTGSTVTFTTAKAAGQEVVVICYKSIDGTGLGSVSDEITELQNKVSTLGDISEYNYICNGATDNVEISKIVKAFADGTDDGKMLTLHIYGTFGATAASGGTGTAYDPFKWFDGFGESTSRRVCLDFENASRVNITPTAGTSNVIFSGKHLRIKNIKCRVNGNTTNTVVVGFDSVGGNVLCENCVFILFGYSGSYLSSTGVFRDCSVSVQNSSDVGRCFIADSASFLRIYGGDYIAYAPSGRGSAVIYIPASATTAVVLAIGVSFPTIAKSGYTQGYAIYDLSANGKCAYDKSVTTLSVSATGQIVTSTIAINKTSGTW